MGYNHGGLTTLPPEVAVREQEPRRRPVAPSDREVIRELRVRAVLRLALEGRSDRGHQEVATAVGRSR